LVANVWEQRGWETTVTTGSSDRGIDVIAEKSSPFKQKHVIQAKRFSAGNKIGGPDVRNYEALKRQESDVDAVVIVTTSSFTSQGQQIANDLNVKIIDGNELSKMIDTLDSNDFLSDYICTNSNSKNDKNKSKEPSIIKEERQKSKKEPKALVRAAKHSSVTLDRLTGNVSKPGHKVTKSGEWIEHVRPGIDEGGDCVYDVLKPNEIPHYFLYNNSKGLTIDGETKGDGWYGSYLSWLVATDSGIRFFLDGEQYEFISKEKISDVEFRTGIMKNRIIIEANGVNYSFPTQPDQPVDTVAQYLTNI
jgi:hypothetical protein